MGCALWNMVDQQTQRLGHFFLLVGDLIGECGWKHADSLLDLMLKTSLRRNIQNSKFQKKTNSKTGAGSERDKFSIEIDTIKRFLEKFRGVKSSAARDMLG